MNRTHLCLSKDCITFVLLFLNKYQDCPSIKRKVFVFCLRYLKKYVDWVFFFSWFFNSFCQNWNPPRSFFEETRIYSHDPLVPSVAADHQWPCCPRVLQICGWWDEFGTCGINDDWIVQKKLTRLKRRKYTRFLSFIYFYTRLKYK